MIDNHKYLIIGSEYIDLIDIDQIQETSIETIRKSIDKTLAIIEWVGPEPDFINNINIKYGPYSLTEIRDITLDDNWVNNQELHP